MMMDLCRMSLGSRMIENMEGDVLPGILLIVNNLVVFLCWSSGMIQVFETMEKFPEQNSAE